MVKSMVLKELHTLEETTMDKVRFLMSDNDQQLSAEPASFLQLVRGRGTDSPFTCEERRLC